MKKVCIIGANGCVGRFFVNFFRSIKFDLIAIDTGFKRDECTDQQLRVDLLTQKASVICTILKDVDILIFAVSTQLLLKILPHILSAMQSRPLLIDTTSTKKKVASFYNGLFYEIGPYEVFSCDPLFRPSDVISRGNVAYFTINATEKSKFLIDQINKKNMHCIECTPEKHDKLLSTIQVLLHSTALTLISVARKSCLNFEILETFSTPPFRMLLLVIQRILSGDSEVYWEIQTENQDATSMRLAFIDEYEKLNNMLVSGKSDNFSDLFEDLKNFALSSDARNSLDRIFTDINELTSKHFEHET